MAGPVCQGFGGTYESVGLGSIDETRTGFSMWSVVSWTPARTAPDDIACRGTGSGGWCLRMGPGGSRET